VGRPTLFTDVEENQLVQWIQECETNHQPQTKVQVLQKVQEVLAIKTENLAVDIPSEQWWRKFRKRHSILTIKKVCLVVQKPMTLNQPMKIEHRRLKAVQDEDTIVTFREALKSLMTTHKYPPSNIWNFDETPFGLDVVASQVVATKGKKKLYHCTVDRTSNITCLPIVNAAGFHLKPLIIFKG